MITPVSMDELHQLSERGVAVYAARYARRMLPLYQLNSEDRERHLRAVAYAVALAEARNAGGDGDLIKAADSARLAEYAATDAGAKHAALAAVTACVCAERVGNGWSDPDEVDLEFKAILYDVGNITDSATLSKIADATKAGKSDLKILRPMLRQRGYEFVDPSELGPLGALWPDGRPT